jgi:hypothetical protein
MTAVMIPLQPKRSLVSVGTGTQIKLHEPRTYKLPIIKVRNIPTFLHLPITRWYKLDMGRTKMAMSVRICGTLT